MGCCGSAFCTRSRSSGTKAGRCSPELTAEEESPWFGQAGENSTVWDSPSPKFIMGGSGEEKYDHPTQKPIELMQRPILNH
jgi:DNA modification methylase